MVASRVCFSFVWLAFLSSAGSLWPLPQTPESISSLEPGRTISREIAQGESHRYVFSLTRNQFASFSLKKKGIQLELVLSGPDNQVLTRADSRGFPPTETTLFFLSEASGNYRLEVRPIQGQKEGRYELTFRELRTASATDQSRVAAHTAYLEGERLRLLGTAESLRNSVKHYEAALPYYRKVSDAGGEAYALIGLGRVRDTLGEKQKALDLFHQAVSLHRTAGNRIGQAYALNFMALTCDHLGERNQGLNHLNEALSLARTAEDIRVEGVTLNNLAVIYHNLGERQKAIELYNQALPLHRASGNTQTEAYTLQGLGGSYDALGEKQKAIEFLEQALTLRRMVGHPGDEASTLNALGAIYFSTDDYQKALELYDLAVSRWRLAGDRLGEGATLHNIAHVHEFVGEYQHAFQFYRQALSLHRAVNYRVGEATILNNLGRLHALLGDHRQALHFYNQALPLHRAVGNKHVEGVTLLNMGASFSALGESQKALDHFDQAFPLLRSAGDRRGEARALNELGRIHLSNGDAAKALAAHEQALQLYRATKSPRAEAVTLAQMGTAHAFLGEHQRALELLRQALQLFRSLGSGSGEASALYNLARVERARGNLQEALAQSEAALGIVEGLRAKVFSQELRSTYFAQVRSYYELNIDVLMQLHKQFPDEGFDARALNTSERARARSLLEILAEARSGIREGINPALLERGRSLQQRINLKAQRQARLLSGRPQEIHALASEIEKLLDEYRQFEAELRAGSPHYAALTQGLPVSLREIQNEVLDSDTLLLEYALGEERSYLWAITSDSIHSYELPKRAEIEAASRRLYELIKNPPERQGAEEAAAALSEMLLAPAGFQLNSKRLAIVADGGLHYLPFAALPLAAKHEIVNLPSVSVLALLRQETAGRQTAEKTLAVLADPVYSSNDPRVASHSRTSLARSSGQHSTRDSEEAFSGTELPRLIGSRREAAAISSLVSAEQRRQAIDFEASRSTAMDPALGRYRMIHFATHGLLNNMHPELSGIVLSLVDKTGRPQDGFLRLHEIYNLQLPAELVVLSACQTALGQEIRGEGLVGLTRGFMYAGAARIVASLWKVDDKATSELMKHFYQGMLGPQKLRPAAALRAAQLAVAKQKRWNSPYYWAGFILQGEWQ